MPGLTSSGNLCKPLPADRFAEYSASQCGFCTPGFIVATHQALTKCQEKGEKPTEDVLQKGLDGNLCRCTGYRPILDACKVRRILLSVVLPLLHSATPLDNTRSEGCMSALITHHACLFRQTTCMPVLHRVPDAVVKHFAPPPPGFALPCQFVNHHSSTHKNCCSAL